MTFHINAKVFFFLSIFSSSPLRASDKMKKGLQILFLTYFLLLNYRGLFESKAQHTKNNNNNNHKSELLKAFLFAFLPLIFALFNLS